MSKYQLVTLGKHIDILSGCAFPSSGFNRNNGVPLIRIRDIISGKTETYYEGSYDLKYLIKKGDLLVGMDGDFNREYWKGTDALLNQRVCKITSNSETLDKNFLYHFLQKELDKIHATTDVVTVKHLSVKKIQDIKIKLPTLEEQKRISAILDKAAGIRQKSELAIKLADGFLRATFLKMFGDPVENPKGWDVASLLEYGSFKNGMNYTKGESGSTLKCLGVGDFKSLATITCMDCIGKIELNTPPSADYLLKDGDIVFVRSNGNKALVGRCLTIYPGKEEVTFSGFCIRYRIENPMITPEYLNFLFRTPSMKQQMLSGGQGANIQSISQSTLSILRIPVPPLEKQQAFSKIVAFHSELMKKLNVNAIEKKDMFDSISQQYFN